MLNSVKMNGIGQKIRNLANSKGLSLKTLAKEIGVTEDAFIDIGELRLKDLHAISILFGVNVSSLLGMGVEGISALSIGEKNITISANGRVNSFFYPVGSRDSDYLARIELLERVISEKQALIDEKERLISILLAREHSNVKEPHML